MNIISNTCLGAYIYRDILKTEFKNPFIWTFIRPKHFLTLLENYESLNFSNIHLEKRTDVLNEFKLIIDNKLEIECWHMVLDPKSKTPKSPDNRAIYYYKIQDYIINNYQKRLNRMTAENNMPTICCERFDDYINELIKICYQKKYKLLLFTNKITEINNNNLLVLNYKCVDDPRILANTFSDKIKNFLI